MTLTATLDRTRWDVVALGFACGIVGMFQTAKMSVSLHLVRDDIGLSLVEASWSVTAVSLTGALLGVQAGRISTEYGTSRTLVFALVLSAAAALATAVVSDPAVFLASRVIEGLGYLLVCAAAPAMMAAYAAPRHRGVALAIWGAFVPVSVAIMSLVGPMIVLVHGWRPLFLVSAATALLMAAAVVLLVRDPAPAGSGRLSAVLRSAPGDFAALYTSLSSLGLGVAFMAFAAIQVGYIALAPLFLIDARGLDLATAGVILMTTTPFAIVGTVIAGFLIAAGVEDVPMGIAGFTGMALFAAAIFLVGPAPLALIVAGAAFFTAGGVVGSVLFASLPKRATAAVGVPLLSGLLVQFGNVGALVGAPIFAGVVQGWSWQAAPIAIAMMAALGIAGVVAGRH